MSVHTIQQVADHLHVHPQTVRTWIRTHQIGAIEVGSPGAKFRRWRITDEQLAEFVESRTVGADIGVTTS